MAGKDEAKQDEALKVFISYSRAQVDFADDLELSLVHNGHDVIIDRHDIAHGESDFQVRLQSMLESCDTVVFVLSDESAASEICVWETETAKQLGKRTLVVSLGNLSDGIEPPSALANINWIHCWRNPKIPGSSQTRGFVELDEALRTDIGWLRMRTEIQEDALNWERRGGDPNSPILLRGELLDEALSWSRSTPASETVPDEIASYIKASEDHENRMNSEAMRQATAVRRVGFTVGAVAFVFLAGALVASWFAWDNSNKLKSQQIVLDNRSVELAEITTAKFASEAYDIRAKGRGDVTAMLMALYGSPAGVELDIEDRLKDRLTYSTVRSALAHATTKNRLLGIYEVNSGEIWTADFHPDGERFIAGHADGSITVWKIGEHQPITQIETDSWINSISISADGAHFISGHDDGDTRLWRMNSSEPEAVFEAGNGYVYSVAFHPDGERFVTGHEDGTTQLWSVDEAVPVSVFETDDNRTYSVAFHPDEDRIITGHQDGRARVWQIDHSGSEPETVFYANAGLIWSVAMHPDGEHILTGHEDGKIRIWEIGEEAPIEVLDGKSRVFSLAVHPGRELFVSGYEDGRSRLWRPGSSAPEMVFNADGGQVLSVAVHPKQNLLLTGHEEGVLRLWSIDTKPAEKTSSTMNGIESIALNPDGERFLLASSDGSASLWRLGADEPDAEFDLGEGYFRHVAFHRDQDRFISTDMNGKAHIWRLGALSPETVYGEDDNPIWSVQFHPDGQKLFTGHADGAVHLWTLGREEPDRIFSSDNDAVTSITLNVSGDKFLARYMSGNLALWDVEDGVGSPEAISLDDEEDWVSAAVLDPVNPRFYSAHSDNTIKTWSIGAAEPDAVIDVGGFVDSLTIHPNGEWLYSVDDEHGARVWRINEDQLEQDATFLVDRSAMKLAVHPDGNSFVIGTYDGQIKLWQLPEILLADSERQIELACAELKKIRAPLRFRREDLRAYPLLRDIPKAEDPEYFVSPCAQYLDSAKN